MRYRSTQQKALSSYFFLFIFQILNKQTKPNQLKRTHLYQHCQLFYQYYYYKKYFLHFQQYIIPITNIITKPLITTNNNDNWYQINNRLFKSLAEYNKNLLNNQKNDLITMESEKDVTMVFVGEINLSIFG